MFFKTILFLFVYYREKMDGVFFGGGEEVLRFLWVNFFLVVKHISAGNAEHLFLHGMHYFWTSEVSWCLILIKCRKSG